LTLKLFVQIACTFQKKLTGEMFVIFLRMQQVLTFNGKKYLPGLSFQ